ncbi:MAG: hypothetical protein AB7O57_06645 [Hyphomicrobiaceae bacterium]
MMKTSEMIESGDIRVLEASEVDHVSGGLFWGIVSAVVGYAVSHPDQTVSAARRVWNWVSSWF